MNEDPCSPVSPGSPESTLSKKFSAVSGNAHPLSTNEPGFVNEFILLKNYLFPENVPTNEGSYLGFSEEELSKKLEEFYKDKQGDQWPRLFHTPERATKAFREYLINPKLYIAYQAFLDKFTCPGPPLTQCFLLVSSNSEVPPDMNYLQSEFKTRVPFMQPMILIRITDALKKDPFFLEYILPNKTGASPDIEAFLKSTVNQKGGRSRLKVQSTRRKQSRRKSRKSRKSRKTRRAY